MEGGKVELSIINGNEAPLTSKLVQQGTLESLRIRYDVDNAIKLGAGGCGAVYAVRLRETGDVVAMKKIQLPEPSGESVDLFEELKQEIDIQKRLDHPNIAKVLESFEDRENRTMYIMQEVCTGGSLLDRLKKRRNLGDELFVATLVEKMLVALNYCHSHGVAHRDIKLGAWPPYRTPTLILPHPHSSPSLPTLIPHPHPSPSTPTPHSH